jgi:hypothetical protein
MALSPRPDGVPEIAEMIKRGTGHEDIRARVTGLLASAAAGARRQTVVSHPLGFACLPVLGPDPLGLCVHVWKAGLRTTELTTSRIHYHTWDLYSHVLYGRIRDERIDVTREHPYPPQRVVEIRSQGGIDRITRTGELVGRRVADVQTHTMGDRYLVAPRQYHQSYLVGPLAVTVMVSENWTPEPQRALADPGVRDHEIPRRLCTPAEGRRLLAEVLDTI